MYYVQEFKEFFVYSLSICVLSITLTVSALNQSFLSLHIPHQSKKCEINLSVHDQTVEGLRIISWAVVRSGRLSPAWSSSVSLAGGSPGFGACLVAAHPTARR